MKVILSLYIFFITFLVALITFNVCLAQEEWDSSVIVFDYHPFPDPEARFYQRPEGQIFAIHPEIL